MITSGKRRRIAALWLLSRMRARAGVVGMSGLRSASTTKMRDICQILSLPLAGPSLMRDRCRVAQAGEVFLAPVSWRPSPRCTGSASPCACLTAGLEGLELERPFESPNLDCSQLTIPASEETGSCSALGMLSQAPGLPVGSLTLVQTAGCEQR